MKIHTTQVLNSIDSRNISTMSSSRIRKSEGTIQYGSQYSINQQQELTFKGKGSGKIIKSAIKEAKKGRFQKIISGDTADKIYNNTAFRKVLKTTKENEVLVQALASLGVCCVLRPVALDVFSGGKDKNDITYAKGHSWASGITGALVALLITTPFTKSINKVIGDAHKYIKDDLLKEMYPHLDLKSISKNGQRVPMKEWLDTTGRIFLSDTKNVRKIPLPKHISEVKSATLEERIKNIDLNSMFSGGTEKISANNWKTKDGNKIAVDIKDIFIAVDKNNKIKYYPLEHVNPEVLKDVYPELEIASITAKDGTRLNPDKWLTKDGKQFELDLDSIFFSSERDNNKQEIPLVAGYTRETIEKGKKVVKDICYQPNNKDEHDLGTEISTEMLNKAGINAIQIKDGSWIIDILLRVPVAAATIAFLPPILKNVFGLEKTKDKLARQNAEQNAMNEAKVPAPEIQLNANAKEVA